MQVHLLSGTRKTIAADSHPIRQKLFEALRRTNPFVNIIYTVHSWLGRTRLSSCLISSLAIASWMGVEVKAARPPRLVSVAVHANARRKIGEISNIYGSDCVCRLQTGWKAMMNGGNLIRLRRLFRARKVCGRFFRLIDRINRRHAFLVATRASCQLGYYARFREELSGLRPGGVLVSSDSNPEEIALVAAARALSIPNIFVSHAYTTTVSSRLDFDLSILEGTAAVSAHVQKGPPKGSIFLAGISGPSRPMNASSLRHPAPTIGIFAPKVVDWVTLRALVGDCRRRFNASKILIRWHPSTIGASELTQCLGSDPVIEETSPHLPLEAIATRCDWIVADAASNSHLDVLKLGIPTIAVDNMGILAQSDVDIYGFLANRIIYPLLPTLAALNIEDAVAFYSDNWSARFRAYDANYLRTDDVRNADLIRAIDQALGQSADGGMLELPCSMMRRY